jgi:uncharacterized membrane protein YfbV (UPF0208 family)
MDMITRWWIFLLVAVVVLLLAVLNVIAGNVTPAIILVLLSLTLAARGLLKRHRR